MSNAVRDALRVGLVFAAAPGVSDAGWRLTNDAPARSRRGVRGGPYAITAGVTRTAWRGLPAWKFDGVSSHIYPEAAADLRDLSEFTAAVVLPADPIPNGKAFGAWDDNGGQQFLIERTATGILAAVRTTGTWTGEQSGGEYGVTNAYAVPATRAGRPLVALLRMQRGRLSLWLDGRLMTDAVVNSSTASVIQYVPQLKFGSGGSATAHQHAYGGMILAGYVWSRALSDAQIVALARDYRAPVRPPRLRIVYAPPSLVSPVISGIGMAASAGSVKVAVQQTAAPAGIAAATATGTATVAAVEQRTALPTGLAAAGTLGTALVVTGTQVAASATGLAASTALGAATTTVAVARVVAPAGLAASVALGPATATIATSQTATVTGLAAVTALGTTGATAGTSVTTAVTGLGATTVLGTAAATRTEAHTVAPAGLVATVALGSATATVATTHTAVATGIAASTGLGVATATATFTSQLVPVAGIGVAVALGATVGAVATQRTAPVTGLAALVALGTAQGGPLMLGTSYHGTRTSGPAVAGVRASAPSLAGVRGSGAPVGGARTSGPLLAGERRSAPPIQSRR